MTYDKNWIYLTLNDMRAVLSEDELTALQNISTVEGNDRVQQVIYDCSETWRGALRAHGYEIYQRPGYIPLAYKYWILVFCRHALWTVFPMSPSIALDDARKEEYEQCLKILEKMPMSPTQPDYSDDPELSGNVETHELGDSIFVPRMRLDTWRNYMKNELNFPI